VSLFDSSFLERYPQATQPVVRPEGDSQARYGANLLPVGYEQQSLTTPLFCYSYIRTRAALEELRGGERHPCHGLKLQYANPATGGYPMPTIGAFMQLLPAGFRGCPYRSTDGTVYSVVEGRGRSQVAGKLLEWEEKDTFVVPSWAAVRHETDVDAVLFSFSDRPAQKALGLWREEAPCE
jgi:gentisate 1,2-dioxygenase